MTVLIGLCIGCDLLTNITAGEPVAVGGIVVPAVAFLYTITFTLIDLINEGLGKVGARRVVATAFAANRLLAGYTQLAIWLPSAPFYANGQAFAAVLRSTPRIIAASLMAYLSSSLVDTEIRAWWRQRVARAKWMRVLASNTVSTFVDSVLFIGIAFAGERPVLPLVWGQYLVKTGITAASLPLIYLATGPHIPKRAFA